MLDSRVCSLLPVPASAVRSGGSNSMSILGEYPFLDRLDRGASYGLGGLNLGPPPGFRPHTPRLWRPTVWGSPPPPPCPPLPPQPHTLPLCPEPCHLPALAGVGVTHLFDYMASARLWYPWYYKGGDSIFGGSQGLDGYGDVSQGGTGGGKELPSRSLKADRLKERQDLSQVLHIDKEHAAAIQARKTTTTISTQTQFSSFNGEAPPPGYPGPPPGPPPAYFAPRGDHPSPHSPSHHPVYGPPPTLPPPPPPPPHTTSSSTSPPASHLVDLSHADRDVQNAPLNLSLSSSPTSVSSSSAAASSRQPPRPSVIACMLSSSSSPVSSRGSSPWNQNGHNNNVCASPTGGDSNQESDPAIEEHFRRSLGKSYGDSIPKTTATSATTSVPANVSITESVDDHFAKALGDSTWKAIKSQNDPSLNAFTGSVDDHFAKALGANTWRRIKAETENSENSNTSSTTGSNNNNNNISNNNSNNHSPNSSASNTPPHSRSSLGAPVAT